MARRVSEDLIRLLSRDKVIDDPDIVRLYAREPSGISSEALAVVFPENVRDVSKIASYAYKNNVPVYPQGSTTDLVGGAVPEPSGIIVSFERMNKIVNVNILDSTVDVEVGVRLGDLNVELAKHGYMFPIDPASVNIATVGGAINSGAGGLRGAKYGTMRDWVLRLTIVLPDETGTIMNVGCRTTKCRQGYDLVRLIVGSEGTLALVAEATLKIAPLPETMATALAFFPTLENLFEAYREIKSSGVQPLIMEFMDHETAKLAGEASKSPINVEGHMLLVSVDCNFEAVERIESWLRGVMEKNGAVKVYTSKTIEGAEPLFTIRRSLFPAQVAIASELYPGRKKIVFMDDIAVPPSKILEAVKVIKSVSEEKGLKVSIGGHIGDGNLHPSVAFPLDDDTIKKKVLEWEFEISKIAVELGGTVSAEHGIGLRKKEFLRMEMEKLGSVKALEIMKGVKKIFDPKGILNPGKVV
ncbi:MAG: FAD-linked oxidase C-terminal domain-containing protein [Thermoprotei archaeon]|nr:FAD-linked oxidase C-terminal domain-containing protein [Thermoprotei archaeon]